MSVPEQRDQLDVRCSLVNIEMLRNHSERFRAECFRLVTDTKRACNHLQTESNKELEQRLRDVQFLKQELEQISERITEEVDDLITLQSRVSKALETCKEPLRITLLCLEERLKHPPSERLHDVVNIELLKERNIIEDATHVLQRVLEQIIEQIRLNRSAKYKLQRDVKNKSEAQCTDELCASLSVSTIDKRPTPCSTTTQPSLAMTPQYWQRVSDLNIARAEQQNTNSVSLRTLVEPLLLQTAADIQRQLQATTAAFSHKVHELKAAKNQMEEQLDKVLSECVSQQRTSEDVQQAITESEQALSVAQAQVALRQHRPAQEQCYDPAQFQLFRKIQNISAHLNELREALSRSSDQQRALLRCQLELQDNIRVKSSSLYIDEVVCAQHRRPVGAFHF